MFDERSHSSALRACDLCVWLTPTIAQQAMYSFSRKCTNWVPPFGFQYQSTILRSDICKRRLITHDHRGARLCVKSRLDRILFAFDRIAKLRPMTHRELVRLSVAYALTPVVISCTAKPPAQGKADQRDRNNCWQRTGCAMRAFYCPYGISPAL